jgi:aldose 1-epimerase
VALWFDASCTWLQVFTAESPGEALHRRGVAVEPMTCPPNAFATGKDVVVLQPGESLTTSHGIMALDV